MKLRRKSKKQTYWSVFLGVFVPIGFITAVLIFVGINLFYFQMANLTEKDHRDSYIGSAGEIHLDLKQSYMDGSLKADSTITDLYAQYLVRTHFRLCMASGFGNAAVLYVKENGTYVRKMDSSMTTFIVLRNEITEEAYMFECPIDELDAQAVEIMENTWKAEEPDAFVKIEMDEVYVKGGSFLPSDYSVVSSLMSETGTEPEEAVLIRCEGVHKAPEGYTKIVVDNQTWKMSITPIFCGNDEVSEELQKLRKAEKENVGDNWTVMRDSNGFYQSDVFDNMSIAYINEAGEDQEALLMTAFCYDMPREWGAEATLISVLVFLFAIGLSALIAHNYYKSYKVRLCMEQYRRETTNALAHDLKSPLMLISGYAENLKENIHEEKREYYAQSIIETSQYMNQIISSLFDLTETEDPEYKLHKEKCNLREMTENLLKDYANDIQKKGIDSKIEGTEEGMFDSFLLQRALSNLIDNAVKYTPEQGTIEVCMKKGQLSIINTGHISDEKLKRVFKPFVKGDAARTGENGTGIGLTVVKNIMEMHDVEYKIRNTDDSVEFVMRFS